jgi:hypothetical protein
MSSQPDGALYELVARGKKDVYFVTSNPAQGIHPFNHAYDKIEPHLTEIRTQPSRNIPQFGQSIEFELERYGDTLLAATLLITMPTWLPEELPLVSDSPPISSKIVNDSLLIKSVADDAVYGWTNGIGYFLIDTLELYQDKIIICQTTGEALWLSQMTEDGLISSYMRAKETGQYYERTPHAIAANATPGITDKNGKAQLRIPIPWPGISEPAAPYGFPLLTTTAHTFRIKVKLKKAARLIDTDSSLSREPWGQSFYYNDINGDTVVFDGIDIRPPTIMLETRQAYLRDEMRRELVRNSVWEIPFRRWFSNIFPININDYSPLDKGGVVTITRRLDGVHPTSRVLFMVRSEDDLCSGKQWKLVGEPTATNTSAYYWGDTKFLIAGKEREFTWDSTVYNKLGSLKRGDSMPLFNGAGSIDFNYSGADASEPSGTINMSQADRPSIQMQLLDAGTRQSEIYVITEAWGIYAIADGRGYVKFIN